MTFEEAREELKSIDYLCKCACNICTANDWYCPTECGTLRKARRIDFKRIVNSYARNDGDWSKVLRFINQAKIECKKGR
ncbi:MAG: hypothetical protein HFE79_05925 [Ruminiclostridium sp.]|nr:hypothetical protein [Ruminiclostridium sp.]